MSDEERRLVAAALREYASFDCEDEGEEECLVDCADWGERVLNLLDCGDTESKCYARLADLIDPDCEEGRYSVARTVRPVDREALLAQVKELEKCAWYFGLDFDADEPLRDRLKEASEDFAGCARCIREALGVTDG